MKRAESIVKRLVLGVFVAAAVVCGGSKHPQTVPNALQVEAIALDASQTDAGRPDSSRWNEMIWTIAFNRPNEECAARSVVSPDERSEELCEAKSLEGCEPYQVSGQRGSGRARSPNAPQLADAGFFASNWNRRGAWRDSFRFDFADGWVFPWGSNHLAGVEVVSWGAVWPAWNDTNAIARLGVPVSIVPGLTTFGVEYTPSNTYRFAWTDAAANRDTNTLITAAIELLRCGDVVVTTNGAAARTVRELPFPHYGYGQDDEWVAANFTNAEEIAEAGGYAAWVDAQVGEGLTNGLYKFTATFPEVPPETVRLFVGGQSLAVTNAGEYAFLLEKGVEYEYGTWPFMANVAYSAADDVGAGGSGVSPLCSLSSSSGGTPLPPVESRKWTADGGYGNTPQTADATGRVWWLPTLRGSPDVSHIGLAENPMTFTAGLTDWRGTNGVTFAWTASEGLTVASPNAQTTEISIDEMPSWAQASLSVTATIGNHTLTSYLDTTYGTNTTPQVHIALNVPHIWVNTPANTNNLRTASVRFSSDAPTNGTLTVSFEGNSEHLHMAQSSWTFPIDEAMSSGQTWELGTIEGVEACSSVGEERFSWTFTPEVGEAVSGEARTTVARVLEVDLWSAKGGASANPPPFEGQTTCNFSVMRSPKPDKHYPVFFKDVVDDGLSVAPYEVEYRVTTQPGGFSVPGGRTELARLDGPESGTLRGAAGKTAYFDTPSEGGVYKIGVAYADSPTTETILVLPLAGASVDAVFDEDMIALDVIMSRLDANVSWLEKQTPDFGNQWFYNANVMDYLGRTDNAEKRTVWCYNQVSDNMFSDGFRMGAVATFRGIPTRLTKLGNFMAGYGTKRINVLDLLRIFSQLKGTRNDTTADMSWDAGTDVANGSNLVERTAMLATNMWFVADLKERQLWPNPVPADNHLETKRDFDYNRYFVSPGAVQTSRRWVMLAQ